MSRLIKPYLLSGIVLLLAAFALYRCGLIALPPHVTRVANEVDGFDLVLDDAETPVPFGLFEVGDAIRANYAYFTYRGRRYSSAGAGSVVIRDVLKSQARYVVRETPLARDWNGRIERSRLEVFDKVTGEQMARRNLVDGEAEDSTRRTGDHALKFIRNVLQSTRSPHRAWGIADYPAADARVTFTETAGAGPYPNADISGNCPPSVRINRRPSSSTVAASTFEFLPALPLRFVACDSGMLLVASGIYGHNLNLDLLTLDGQPLAQGTVQLPLPLDALQAGMSDVHLEPTSIRLTILANHVLPDYKPAAYRQVSLAARLQSEPEATKR